MKELMLEYYEMIWNFTEILGCLNVINEEIDIDDFDNKLADILLNRV